MLEPTRKSLNPPIEVSPNNPCPFLRALVAEEFVDGHTVPLSALSRKLGAASGERGLKKFKARVEIYLVALFANGLAPWRVLKSWWSGAELDRLRNGPLDKHGVGSRILDAEAHVRENEIARLAEFGHECKGPSGEIERGLTEPEIAAFMKANLERAKDIRRWYDRFLMKGEWPVLLRILGKGEGKDRYLSVAEVRTLFADRRLPDRILNRIEQLPAPSIVSRAIYLLNRAVAVLVAAGVAALVATIEFPDQVRAILPEKAAELLPPPLPERAPTKAAHWLEQNWKLADRHWFHHASQGTATFPVPYAMFVALEQPSLGLFRRPGLLMDSKYLERFGFIPSPKSIHVDEATLARFGYSAASDKNAEPLPAPVAGLRPTVAENFDGLPVGFARMPGTTNPGTGQPEPDRIGLTCAACHTGQINYKGVSVRYDGGPAMLELRKLEKVTGLSILYTLYIPGRFDRFATRVLGPEASAADRDKLKKELAEAFAFVKAQVEAQEEITKKETAEGFGRLDALNRIGNQVFYTDLAAAKLTGFEKNLRPNDAPVSFPPIWTVPWFLWAQYDASIEQPLIRNAGEALGVSALLNLSPDLPKDTLFRSSVALENLSWIEEMLRGSDPFTRDPKGFGGLQSPKWPSALFPDDPAWTINQDRVKKGRKLYAEICVECHLGPVNDAAFKTEFRDMDFWSPDNKKWAQNPPVLAPVQKSVTAMGTDSAQANVLATRKVDVPGFLDLQPARDLGQRWGCKDIPETSSTNMDFSLALMIVVDRVSQKWMDERKLSDPDMKELWGPRKNCPNPAKGTHYRARPLNGVWATAPYLHNGSVPSLYWLLKPAAERPKQFCMGDRDFDPEQVGYRVVAGETPKCKKGETLFSMMGPDNKPITGNSVLGHSLEGSPPFKNGIIGRGLSDEERLDLIEYLKTL